MSDEAVYRAAPATPGLLIISQQLGRLCIVRFTVQCTVQFTVQVKLYLQYSLQYSDK